MKKAIYFLLPLSIIILFLGASQDDADTPPSYTPTHTFISHWPSLPPANIKNGPLLLTKRPVGISVEYQLLERYLGKNRCPPPVLVREMLRLGSPELRLGGNSSELTQPSGNFRMSGVKDTKQLSSDFWKKLHCLLKQTHQHITVTLNAKAPPDWAYVLAQAAKNTTSHVEFSLGNEPDLAWRGKQGWERYMLKALDLRKLIPTSAVIGPELAVAENWRPWLATTIQELKISRLGVHLYPLDKCRGRVSIKGLLSFKSGQKPKELAWVVALAKATHVQALISESNSVACGGAKGVSEKPASAVWATRFVISALLTGFAEVRFHFSGGPYDPFIKQGNRITERPLAYVIDFFNHWFGKGTRISQTKKSSLLVTKSDSTHGKLTIYDNESAHPVKIKTPLTEALVISPLKHPYLTSVSKVIPPETIFIFEEPH